MRGNGRLLIDGNFWPCATNDLPTLPVKDFLGRLKMPLSCPSNAGSYGSRLARRDPIHENPAMRVAKSTVLTDNERTLLLQWARGRKTPARLVQRAKIVLAIKK
jgi:hypothetical protein